MPCICNKLHAKYILHKNISLRQYSSISFLKKQKALPEESAYAEIWTYFFINPTKYIMKK